MDALRRLAVLPLCVALGAAAQTTMHRCGDGRTWSQTPCADARVVVVDDRVSPEAQRAARAVADRDAALAERLARERREREAVVPRRAAGFTLAPRADDRSAERRTEPKRETRRVRTAANRPPTARR